MIHLSQTYCSEFPAADPANDGDLEPETERTPSVRPVIDDGAEAEIAQYTQAITLLQIAIEDRRAGHAREIIWHSATAAKYAITRGLGT
jgi:hypothetical protein